MAVAGPSWRLAMLALSRSRSVVGATRTWAVPEKDTRPTLSRGGTRSMNVSAAALAARSRVGSTSVASMDRETSMAITIVARSLGTLVALVGWAKAVTRVARARRKAAAGSWRRHPGRRGATERRSSRLVNRT